ncbi:hypothetical protein HJFPF1_13100 [Paramyrothecium foliicola]|nr:hypothetical protein HJFPF1_13100 [Paramyrothecium foliicola]
MLDEVNISEEDGDDDPAPDDDYVVTSRASLTPFELSDEEDVEVPGYDMPSSTLGEETKDGLTNGCDKDEMRTTNSMLPCTDEPISRSKVLHKGRDVFKTSIALPIVQDQNLDYLLVSVRPQTIVQSYTLFNRVWTTTEDFIEIREVSEIGDTEKKIFAITSSHGVISGTLLPGATSCFGRENNNSQKLYVLNLDGVVFEGDSGGAVVDASSGCLYGHIVLGVPNTSLAYISSASEMIQHIEITTRSKTTLDLSDSKADLECLPTKLAKLPTRDVGKAQSPFRPPSPTPTSNSNHSLVPRPGHYNTVEDDDDMDTLGHSSKKRKTSNEAPPISDNAMARFLFINWNKVASDPMLRDSITNGHAARMRYLRLQATILEFEPRPQAKRAHVNSTTPIQLPSFPAEPKVFSDVIRNVDLGTEARGEDKVGSKRSLTPLDSELDSE